MITALPVHRAQLTLTIPPITSFSFSLLVLDKYGLTEFQPLVEGIRKGDLRTFQDGLVKYQDRFIRYVCFGKDCIPMFKFIPCIVGLISFSSCFASLSVSYL